MTLASSSASALAYIEEGSYGELPVAGNGAYLRKMDEDLGFDYTTTPSKEINATRQTPDAVVTDASAGGGVNFELSYREYDPFFEALLASTFVTGFTTGSTGGIKTLTVSIVASTGVITDDGVDGFAGLVAGQWILISGAEATGNNGVKRIASRTDDAITVDASTPMTADATADTGVSFSAMRMANGVAAPRSFVLEQQFTDVPSTGLFLTHLGRMVTKLDINFATGAILTGNLGFLGATCMASSATTNLPGTTAASKSYGVMNCVTGLGGVFIRTEAGVDLLGSAFVQSMTLSIDAKLREQKALGVLGNAGIGLGTFAMGGTVNIYLADAAIYDKALAQELISITIPVYDSSYNGYAFTFDHVKLGVPKISAGSGDTDVMMACPFTIVAPATATDKMIKIDRFGASVA